MVSLCRGGVASPYENEEILYLSTVAGLIRKEPFLINLFLPSHQHSAYVNTRLGSDISRLQKLPTKNPLFDTIDNGMRQIALVPGEELPKKTETATAETVTEDPAGPVDQISNSQVIYGQSFDCDCAVEEDRLALLDAILGYVDSPVSHDSTILHI